MENLNKCIKEIGWWIFKSKTVIHDFEITGISKFMRSSETYHVHKKCKECGSTKISRFVKHDDLLLAGFPAEELEKITPINWYHPNKL